MTGSVHRPVLLHEVVKLLVTRKAGMYLDCTLGMGGHSREILKEISPVGKLVGTDRDPQALEYTSENLKEFSNTTFLQLKFSQLGQLEKLTGVSKFTGILFDLGIGSWHIDRPERGFSYRSDAPLDMRMDPSQKLSAYSVINDYDAERLAQIFKEYGEERLAKRIARKIKQARTRIETTGQLRAIIETSVPASQKIKSLSRVFQAVRMEVNQEIEELKAGLSVALQAVEPSGRVGIISYHSLEDRLVKETFRELSKKCICPPRSPICVCGAKAHWKIITSKPVRPTLEEVESNPRARSAKFRVIEKLD